MRIARVMTRLNLGGPARQALGSDPLLRARGHAVRLFCGEPEPGEGDLADRARELGLDIRRVPGLGRALRPLDDARAARFLTRALGEFAPDVVHTHASKAGALGRRAALRLSPRPALVHTFHGHVLEGYFRPLLQAAARFTERRLARRTDAVLAVSEATAGDLERLGIVAPEGLEVVPPGLDLGRLLALDPDPRARGSAARALRAGMGLADGDCLVLCLGRLAAVKRPELALDAALASGWLARDGDELGAGRSGGLALAFAGDGPERRLLEQRLALLEPEQRGRVHLLGPLEDSALALEAADLLLMTSRSEGLPVALIEAAAAGRPSLAPDVGGICEVLEGGRSGELSGSLLPGAPAEALVAAAAQSLARLADSPSERVSLGRAAREGIEERFSARRLADDLERVYRRVAGERGAAAMQSAAPAREAS